jgi:uncharacterized RDD family membrane protein YckC
LSASPATPQPTLDGVHTVRTPEYVEFNFVLAGVYSRFLAWVVDTLVVIATYTVIVLLLTVGGVFAPGFFSAIGFVVWFLLDWGYGIAFEAFWSGQTLGKRMLSLRVIQESGVRIGFYHAVLRNLARPVDRLPLIYLVGGVTALFTRSRQRLGDLLAGTVVVRERRLTVPADLSRPQGEVGLLSDSLFQAKVKRLSPEERELIFSAALRREELGMEARLSLFAQLAKRLEEEVDLVKPAHLSDEKLVLLVAAALASGEKRHDGKRHDGKRQ